MYQSSTLELPFSPPLTKTKKIEEEPAKAATPKSPPTILEEIANFTFTSKYARYSEARERRETWNETVARVERMHLKRFSFLSDEDKEEIRWAFNQVREKRVLPSMRSMQFGGKAIEVKNERMFNCAALHMHSPRAFAEFFYLSLCGTGVGIGLRKKFYSRLPDLVDASDRTGTVITYVIEDTIEGWSDSVEALLHCYFRATPYSGRKIVFDYSKIRAKGTPLKTSGGLAPGYKPLKNALTKVKALLDQLIEEKGLKRLRSIDIYDILMHCADAVVSGGIRRSATIALFEPDDIDMMTAKTGDWFKDNPQRGRSNNSVLLFREDLTRETFAEIIRNAREFGEPGFVLVDHEDALTNPCAEISLVPVTQDGVCGIQFCNLTTQNGAKIKSIEDWEKSIRAATLIGTLQAAYTESTYLGVATKEITDREALLGVSLTGWLENPTLLLNPEHQRAMARLSVEVNREWAKKIGVNPAARITTTKPEGTSSLVLGTASGIHPHHARQYFRRIQCDKINPVYKHFALKNPHATEESVWSANKTDDIATFPIEVSEMAMVKSDLTALAHLKIVKDTQVNYVRPGANDSVKGQHNVSCTVIVKENEWEDVIDYLYNNRADFCAVSLLPATGDKTYVQAPMEAVTTQADKERFSALVDNWTPVKYTEMVEVYDSTTHMQEAACAGGNCEV